VRCAGGKVRQGKTREWRVPSGTKEHNRKEEWGAKEFAGVSARKNKPKNDGFH